MESFENLTPYIIFFTIIISGLIALGIDRKSIWTVDKVVAVLGFFFGIFMTFMNTRYTSNELLLLSPIIAVSSMFYLRYRDKILKNDIKVTMFEVNKKTLNLIQISYWLLITASLITYYQSLPYYRSETFFIIISACVSLLGIEILLVNFTNELQIFEYIIKILLVSTILRASSYFVSSFPIGSDPWAHAEYIKSFLYYHSIAIAPGRDFIHQYYVSYPVSHLFVVATSLISNFGIKESMFIMGMILTLSSVFTYLIVKNITNDSKISLISMLLLNFADLHIQWGIEIIAMSFGVALYTIIMYLILGATGNKKVIYASMLVLYFFVITWTHTISAFITLISIGTLYIGSEIYKKAYKYQRENSSLITFTAFLLIATIMIYHWIDPKYPFLGKICIGLINTLFSEAKFLVDHTMSNIVNSIWMLPITFGFLIYTFCGIIGSLYSISENHISKKYFSFLFMVTTLYILRYSFPIFGMNNIIPERWPSFIYVIFVLFISIGFYNVILLFKSEKQRTAIALIFLLTSTFFMTTNLATNKDSPIYGEEVIQRYVWTESEMSLYRNINLHYDNIIVADKQTAIRPFSTYFQRNKKKMMYYPQLEDGNIDWNSMSGNLIVWRESSLKRPVNCDKSEMLLGTGFKNSLDDEYSCVFYSGEARAFI
ncbi:hypothetical protein EO95_17175 [Methanosarcina sp. 1.H.T.1A.1]|uniref:hypothetical protein n=1 Tax=Methanosarcina sp. 1.H.T.1A.1 TaxID=1483602 RepID=UPI0006215B33|nr:hypothetical protein [Methanosarcina sp. 1.H.T.1A.1]KKH94967.1 hypothetical protein EO95_17175 [Methanosarcina sp. 1.H.T.1A.1]